MSPTALAPGELLVVDRWLTPRACRDILEDLDCSWWGRSELAFQTGPGRLACRHSIGRTSRTSAETWMGADLRRRLRRLEGRLARRFAVDVNTLEPWQAVRYRRDERFDEHHDAGLFTSSPHGERSLSFVLYLDSHPRGGATVFPVLKRRIRPLAGRLLIWRNLFDDGSVDPRMRHAALPARRTKTVLTTWARQRSCR